MSYRGTKRVYAERKEGPRKPKKASYPVMKAISKNKYLMGSLSGLSWAAASTWDFINLNIAEGVGPDSHVSNKVIYKALQIRFRQISPAVLGYRVAIIYDKEGAGAAATADVWQNDNVFTLREPDSTDRFICLHDEIVSRDPSGGFTASFTYTDIFAFAARRPALFGEQGALSQYNTGGGQNKGGLQIWMCPVGSTSGATVTDTITGYYKLTFIEP